MEVMCYADMIIVAVGIVLLFWNKKFRKNFRYIVPLAILYEASRFMDMHQYYDTNFTYICILVIFRWLLAGSLFWFNRKHLSTICIALGVLLNMIVLLANHLRMPTTFSDYTAPTSMNGRIFVDSHTHLNLLGDWIRFPNLYMVFSIGDLLISTGVILIFFYYVWLKLIKKTV